jgi:hypothetical protein
MLGFIVEWDALRKASIATTQKHSSVTPKK